MPSSATDEVATAATPIPTNNSQIVVYQSSLATPSVKIMLDAEVEKAKFKRRKHPPTKFKDFTNPSGKKFKVNDPCEIDPLRPIEPEQLIFFLNGWTERLKIKITLT